MHPNTARISRTPGLAKTILQGTVKGKRRRGRQKERWEDIIKERTGMDFASSTLDQTLLFDIFEAVSRDHEAASKLFVAMTNYQRPPKVM